MAGGPTRRRHPIDRHRLDRSPMELWDLRVTVESVEGRAVCGMAVGDYFDLPHSSRLSVPAGRHFCIYALAAVLPLLAAKQRELEDDDWLNRESLVCCPDPDERA